MATAIETFRRAMRRHEKRATLGGFFALADYFRDNVRLADSVSLPLLRARSIAFRSNASACDEPRWLRDAWRQRAFLYERVVDAVERLRAAQREEG